VSRQSQFTTNFNRSFIALITNDTKAMVITPHQTSTSLSLLINKNEGNTAAPRWGRTAWAWMDRRWHYVNELLLGGRRPSKTQPCSANESAQRKGERPEGRTPLSVQWRLPDSTCFDGLRGPGVEVTQHYIPPTGLPTESFDSRETERLLGTQTLTHPSGTFPSFTGSRQ